MKIFFLTVYLLLVFSYAYCETSAVQLSKNLCSSCHLFPKPNIMNQEDWKFGAFPYLEHILGLNNLQNYSKDKRDKIQKDWIDVQKYYIQNSSKYANKKKNKIFKSNKFIESKRINDIECSAIYYDQFKNRIFIGDVDKKSIKVFNTGGKLISEINIDKIPVNFSISKNGIFICSHNSLNPTDSIMCEVGFLNKDLKYNTKYSNLNRPTYYEEIYFNGSVYSVLLEFGNKFGSAKICKDNNIIWENNLSGAIDCEYFIRDQELHIFILFAQEHEMLLHLNVSSNVKEKILLKKHPGWGFTGIEINKKKFNKQPVIYLSNGDTTEFQSYPRAYHGIRIYQFENKLIESYFIPVHGILDFKIINNISRKYDDLVTVSYFADFANYPEESLMFHECNENGKFNSYSLPFQTARWARLGIINNNRNHYNIILGSMNYEIQNRVYENNLNYLDNFKIPEHISNTWNQNGNHVLFLKLNPNDK